MTVRTFFLVLTILLLSSCTQKPHKEPNKKTSKPLNLSLGQRLTITGDFDGDGKKEKLIEHYMSRLNNQETYKNYGDGLDYGDLIKLILKTQPYSFISSNNQKIATLPISENDFGLFYLHNEGDLNGDGIDEISYIINHADWSTLNTWHLFSFKKKKWVELYHFPIWEWQLSDNDFDGSKVLRKIRTNKIQVTCRDDKDGMHTILVDLNR